MPLQFGIDSILSQTPEWKTKRIGLLTNDAAKTSSGVLNRLALIEAGFHIVKLFSPEHGITATGEDGAKMEDAKDPITGLPIISLYGEKFMPSATDLEDLDLMMFDIPDAGTRFYTYLWSMTYWIEAAAKFNKQVVILDRPNPIGGDMSMAKGPMLDENIASFIGRFNIPIKHQCTLGELAAYFNATKKWNANLLVIPCERLNRGMQFYDWNLNWENPSPALQNIEAAILYPGLCFFEATNVSLGRGTPYSFEWIGAEWFNLTAINMVAQNILREDLKMETMQLNLPTNAETNQTKGMRIKVIDPYQFDAVFNGLLLLKLVKDVHPGDFKWMPYPTHANPTGKNHLSLLLGVRDAAQIFELPLHQWLQQITKLIKVSSWETNIAPYLLYK
jgi:uncharacterized protein YbbC (DUF1343 family)